MATFALQNSVYSQCENLPSPALDIPFSSEVSAVDDPNVVYLSIIGGDTPVPNDCGLNPSNDAAQWTGWGGPLDFDGASIGEGPGTRNWITVNGVRYERGIGTHSAATFTFDLTGAEYVRFEGVVGLDDEKDNPDFSGQCGHGGTSQFIFSIDGAVVHESAVLRGVVVGGGANAPSEAVAFDIPAGADELMIQVTDGGDGAGCDHADIADAKLIMAGGATPVEAKDKLSASWGRIKATY
jgi:hypothetical protein